MARLVLMPILPVARTSRRSPILACSGSIDSLRLALYPPSLEHHLNRVQTAATGIRAGGHDSKNSFPVLPTNIAAILRGQFHAHYTVRQQLGYS